jgi:hypothetical protein
MIINQGLGHPKFGECGTGAGEGRVKVFSKLNRAWQGAGLDPIDGRDLVKHGRERVAGQLDPYKGPGLSAKEVIGFKLIYPVKKSNIGTAKLCFRQNPTGPPPTTTPPRPYNLPAAVDQSQIGQPSGSRQ